MTSVNARNSAMRGSKCRTKSRLSLIHIYNRSRRTELDLGRFDDSYVRDLKNQLAETGRRLWVLDITSDLGIPSYVAMSHATQNGQDFVEYGSGSHFDPRIALLRALTEVKMCIRDRHVSVGL